MKYIAGVIFAVVALVTFGGSYERDYFSQWESECKTRMTREGLSSSDARAACACVADMGRAWQEKNPDREYTQTLHTGIAYSCAEQHGMSNAMPGSDWGSAEPGYTAPAASDWGGSSNNDEWDENGGWGAQ
ncbi:MAG: hypothetical protein SXU28_09980 [Pseudomonadota bacterium]|nr:hypothetical protein [Pseudomonadota bacterium]